MLFLGQFVQLRFQTVQSKQMQPGARHRALPYTHTTYILLHRCVITVNPVRDESFKRFW